MVVIQTGRRIFFALYRFVIDFLFPPLCAHCGLLLKHEAIFCENCFSKITPVVSSKLAVTATKKITVFAVSSYKDPLRSLLLSKHRSDIVSSYQLGALIWEMTYVKSVPFDYIVPIPLHWTRCIKRGFNQSHEMAKIVAKKSGKPVVSLLKRDRKTRYQASLKKDARHTNVKNCFSLRQRNVDQYKGKHILLIDDLLTSGATARSAAKELYKIKPSAITILVVSRVG